MIEPRTFKAFNPRYICSFDCETYYNEKKKRQIFIMGTVVLWDFNQKKEIEYIFWNKQKMNDFLLSNHFVGHKSFNTAFNSSFDLYMLPMVYSKNFSDYSKGRVYIAKYKHPKRSYQVTRFIDLGNFFSGIIKKNRKEYRGLSAVGELFNMSKLEKPDYLGERKPKTKSERDYLVEYCLVDSKICVVASKWLLKQFQEFETGVCVTPSQFAFRVFQSQFLKRQINMNPIKEQLEIFRDGYRGGRTEAFKLGTIEKKRIVSYDFNSFYVYSMVNSLLPISQYKKIINPTRNDIRKIRDNNICCFANISTKTYDNFIGLIPVRLSNLVFPNGRINTNLYTSELNLLEKLQDYKVESLYIAEGDYILRDYGQWAFDSRNENRSDELLNILYKLFGNSVYGKFAQLNEHLERTPKYDYLLTPNVNSLSINIADVLHTIRFYYNKAFEKTLKPTKLLSIPISAEITSNCRSVLTEHLLKYEDNLLYCDTDSFMLFDKILKESSALGGLKKEAEGNKVVILKEKIYQIYKDDKLIKFTTKGFPKKAIYKNGKIRLKFKNQLCNKFTVSYDTLIQPKSAWIQFKNPYVPITVTKTFDLNFNTKRKLLSDNFQLPIDTIPITLD
jgi:hypothetical protein